MKVLFTLSSGRIRAPARNFSRIALGNAHGRNNLLSFLALRIRELSLLLTPTQGGGMEIIIKSTGMAERIRRVRGVYEKTEVDRYAIEYDERRAGMRGSQGRRQGRYQEVFGIAGLCAGRQGDCDIGDVGKFDSKR